ncbi:MAG TPA: hypothetical protein VFK30_08575 [Anaerolineae bacterium]|nr:hypothetical protein [Anaerolineae bacterium]
MSSYVETFSQKCMVTKDDVLSEVRGLIDSHTQVRQAVSSN